MAFSREAESTVGYPEFGPQWHENPQLHARIRDFWVPPVPEDDLYRMIEQGLPERTYDTGMLPTRVSPVQYGHIWAIKFGLLSCDKVIIGIGSANRINSRTPFPVDLREKWLRSFGYVWS